MPNDAGHREPDFLAIWWTHWLGLQIYLPFSPVVLECIRDSTFPISRLFLQLTPTEYGNINKEQSEEDSKGREHEAAPIIAPPHASTHDVSRTHEYQKEREHNKGNSSDPISCRRLHFLFISLFFCPNDRNKARGN